MRCGQCGSDNAKGSRFCSQCGEQLPGEQSQPGIIPVRGMGVRLDAALPPDERRLVTILFADLVGFTALAERLDAEEVQGLLNQCFDRLVPCVDRYGGTIDRFIGDAVMALFGAPVAHDNDAERAIRAGLDMRAGLADFNREKELNLSLHVGINTGRVLAGTLGSGGRQDYSVVGDAVNLAARLEDISGSNELLIGPQTYTLAGSLFETEEAGIIALRGRSTAVRAYRVLSERASLHAPMLSRLRAPMVGRDKELGVLRQALHRLGEGQGGVVYVLGEAGLGKSRLLAEARRGAASATFRWVEGQAVPMGRNLSYGPIRQIVEQDAGFAPDEDGASRLEKLRRRLAAVLPEDGTRSLLPVAALFCLPSETEAQDWLLSVRDELSGKRLQEALIRYVQGVTADRPLVLVIEDCHWLDTSSAALLERLLPLTEASPLLICLVARPEMNGSLLDPERVAAKVMGPYDEIRLAPLTKAESRELVAELLGSRELPAGLQPSIHRRAEGNPFFIQELLRSLIESGNLEADGKGGWQLTGRLVSNLPDTLEAIIIARVDRLPDNLKQILRLASMIGGSFIETLVLALTGISEPELRSRLQRLEEQEFIRSLGGRAHPEFTFAHALIQSAVYESIPARERRALHARVAAEIESVYASQLETHYALLAHHYSKADRWDQARDYLLKAGARAGDLGAEEATDYYEQALETLLRGYDPGTEIEGEAEATEWFLRGVAPLHNAGRLHSICETLEEFHVKTTQSFGENDRRTLAAAEILCIGWLEKGRSKTGKVVWQGK